MELEGGRAGEGAVLGGELGIEQLVARLQGSSEPLLLSGDHLGDEVVLRHELGIPIAHDLDRRLHQ
jgi:hypothetical protein